MVGQHIGSRDISYHCPILGSKPFNVSNEWFTNKKFIPFVENEWREIILEGMSDYVIKEKLQLLK